MPVKPRSGREVEGQSRADVAGRWLRALPWLVLALCVLWVASKARPVKQVGEYDLAAFASLPVSDGGRLKPVDTVARNTLLGISGRRTVKHTPAGSTQNLRIGAVQWYLDTQAEDRAYDYEVFRVDHPEVLGLLGWRQEDEQRGGVKKLFSFRSFLPHGEKLDAQIRDAMSTEASARSLFQDKVLDLSRRLKMFTDLLRRVSPHAVPPGEGRPEWTTLDREAQLARSGGEPSPDARTWSLILQAYGEGKAGEFNRLVSDYRQSLASRFPGLLERTGYEVFFNRFEPFYLASVLYVVAFLIACASLIALVAGSRASGALLSSSFVLLLFLGLLHSFGLVSRMVIERRPPVTNLYSSAVFIGWVSLVFALLAGAVYRLRTKGHTPLLLNFINLTASSIGFITLVIAHNLASDQISKGGDTMEVMRAVLDSNFWLATHVVTVTMGYGATFVAGVAGLFFILLGLTSRSLDRDARRNVGNLIYGTVCFATFMSFVGTVLGGIWADQSWGRFWGWDPKENGALIIVVWNALILHARWGGMVQARGIATLAVFGNVVTAWSWFGVNQLGIGLHSYGFTDSAAFWTGAFVLSQLHAISAGLLPRALWRCEEPGAADAVRPALLRWLALLNPLYACLLSVSLLAVLPSLAAAPAFKMYLLAAVGVIAALLHTASTGLLRAHWSRGFAVGNVAAVLAMSHVLFLALGRGEDRPYLQAFMEQLRQGGAWAWPTGTLAFVLLAGYPCALIVGMNMRYASFTAGGSRYRQAVDGSASATPSAGAA